jgi:NADP-dependent 3-hydroxy acid dehydrogenase YdfG
MFSPYSAQEEGTMTEKLAGKVAFVTGASSGIGEAIAVALAEEGARVAVLARRSDRLDQIVKRIKDAGGEAVAGRKAGTRSSTPQRH